MSWDKVPISSVCKGIYDGPHATPPVSDSGAVFLGIPNFQNGRLDLSEIRYISEKDLPKWTKRVVPKPSDIVFSYEATLNLYAIIPEGFRGCLGRRMALIRVDSDKAYHKFLYYYFYSPAWRAVVAGNTVLGATVDRIPLIRFPSFEVELPPIEIQHRIADILSAYDDLIENNQKQIKLLEEAAQRLYKEWFVDLRFPGYEDAKISDGVPDGWKKCTLDTLGGFSRGKALTKADTMEGDIPVVAGGLEPAYFHNAAITEVPVITVSGSGANAGFTRMYYQKIWASDCSYIDSYKTENIFFIYCFLKCNKNTMDNLQKGSAQPHVYAKDINALPLFVPTDGLLQLFKSQVTPVYSLIANHTSSIEKLRQARDRLLPKLMSGEIKYKEVPI
ncbi:MAG TPA: restriction endonuclease subunit S [Firmicutes bacterium]|jgi:type I restriction enzyme S subunit|nr:restriction endonuclease subunit S [Bacillota bacterium]HCM17051.1 restriction endonuclease subunit S [Bacillota bacterium]